ncbi:ylmG homolog protein 1-2, chloroplastic-like [Salvia miltiorrhiza]|uniref:ylmG homolog protein 1-2, chloroplastic-like n=1 Tax=Salvia miltiorrhiza TaxID=226208 RepID=UPI0025AC238C|nr:ylmG homolog protein 1-2, chloroplastic-like [Salvia miltiorrhiza]
MRVVEARRRMVEAVDAQENGGGGGGERSEDDGGRRRMVETVEEARGLRVVEDGGGGTYERERERRKQQRGISASIFSPAISKPAPEILIGSTRTITTLVALGLTASKFFAHKLFNLAVQLKEPIEPLLCSVGPTFFAAAKEVPTVSLNTPFMMVAAGMAKWLDLYSGVLMVHVLLSWFPNIPWDRQPLSAIRDLCDPYLNLFRNIIPPIFDTLDVSPLLAFTVLGTLGSILNSSRQSY